MDLNLNSTSVSFIDPIADPLGKIRWAAFNGVLYRTKDWGGHHQILFGQEMSPDELIKENILIIRKERKRLKRELRKYMALTRKGTK